MIAAARELLLLGGEYLRHLLKRSNERLAPLVDPLVVDFGAHRWLSKEPEPAYSDWLKWIIEQLPTPDLVFRIFGIADPEGVAQCQGDRRSVDREVPVPEGHEGHRGFLDLVVRFPEKALIVVEVKKFSPDEAEAGKLLGYKKWIDKQPEPHKYPILLAVEADRDTCEGFEPLAWATLCIELRRMIPELRVRLGGGKGLVVAALALAFIGAVEQNFLGLSASQAQGAEAGLPVKVSSAVIQHIEGSLKEGPVHGNAS
jgi:hypothetical protein